MCKSPKNHGFTLAELLVSVVLLALLMGATSMALSSALTNYEENINSSEMNQSSRAILERMMREIRAAANVTSSANLLQITPADTSQVELIQYVLDNGVFIYTTTAAGQSTSYDLLGTGDGVSVSEFTTTVGTGADGDGSFVSLVTVTITLNTPSGMRQFSASACPRVNRNR